MNAANLLGTIDTIPSGIDGVKATLRIMVSMVREFRKPPQSDPDKVAALLNVRVLAQSLVQSCAEKDYACEASKLHAFVRDHIRYVRDMRTVETLQYPDKTLMLQSGDCDDKSILFCALADSIGFDTRFCAIGVNGEGFSHVSAQCLIPGRGWTNCETIPIDSRGTKVPMGWFPPDATCSMIYHV